MAEAVACASVVSVVVVAAAAVVVVAVVAASSFDAVVVEASYPEVSYSCYSSASYLAYLEDSCPLGLASFAVLPSAFYSCYHTVVAAEETFLAASCSCCPWASYPAYSGRAYPD